MARTNNHSQDLSGSQEAFEAMVRERLRPAVRVALISVLEEEVTAFIGAAPYERNEQRRDHRNGHYTRDLETSVGQIIDLPIPRTRGGHQTQVFERLTGSHPSVSTVSRVFHTLEAEYEQWKRRPLDEHYPYAFADGTYFTVIYHGEGCKMPI